MAAGLNAGMNPQGTISVAKTKTKEEATSSEKTLHINRIDHYDNYGKVRWSFNIDDVYFQESGMIMREDELPTVHFEFTGDSDKPNPPPTSPPEYMEIAITSYWKMTLPSESKTTWIRKLVHFVRSSGNTQAVSYSNLFQMVALKVNPDKLRNLCDYRAEVVLNPGASDHHQVIIKRHPVECVVMRCNAIPAVVKGKYITLLTSGLYESDETNFFRLGSTEPNLFRYI